MEKPDTINVAVGRRDQVLADQVDIYITTKGSSLVIGKDALKKAGDIHQQLTPLYKVGVNVEDLSIEGIYGNSTDGMLGPSTSGTYRVRIRCNDLELLPAILGLVTPLRHARLELLLWRYSSETRLRGEWLQACLVEAREKATRIAAGLGVKLLGVHALSEQWLDSDMEDKTPSGNARALAVVMKEKEQSASLGFPLSQTKRLELRLDVEFRIGDFLGGGI